MRAIRNLVLQPAVLRGADYLAPYLEQGESIAVAGWCAPSAMFRQGLAVTGPGIAAPLVLQGAGCLGGLAVGIASFFIALMAGTGTGASVAIGFVLGLIVLAVVGALIAPTAIVLSIGGLARSRRLYEEGNWPSFYMGLSDRRFMLLGADSWSKAPRAGEFWSCSLSEARCLEYRDYRYKTFVSLLLRGARRDFVVDWHFRPLALALAGLR
ncbi:MAG TPA: hypothetical protein VKE27_03585 [Candidatus Dormibacteraeota bacterium]|nr:hypothetical protein [Candidatus Dormibacteraeota bacterium]